MENLPECVLCGESVLTENNPLTQSTLNRNLTVYFLVKNILEISDLTFSNLLQSQGDPYCWITCCCTCSKTVMEAQRLFIEIKRLKWKLNQLKETLETNVYESSQKSRNKVKGKKSTGANIIEIIRNETVKRLNLSFSNDLGVVNEFEDDVKTEIDVDYPEQFSHELEDPLLNNDGTEECHKNDSNSTSKYKPRSQPRKKTNQKQSYNTRTVGRKTNFKVRTPVGEGSQRSRSGRVIRPNKYKSNSETSIPDKNEKKETLDSDYSPPTSPITMQDNRNEDKLDEKKEECISAQNSTDNDENGPHSKQLFQCTDCPNNYAYHSSLLLHRKFKHCTDNQSEKADKSTDETKQMPKYNCEDCDIIFRSSTQKRKHNSLFHSERKFKCELCTCKFGRKSFLEKHVIRSHDKCRYKCGECGKLTRDSRQLQSHIAVVHRKERNFICEVCNMQFTMKMYLKYHQKKFHDIDLGNKKVDLQCNECGKVLCSVSALNVHIDTVHRGVFKFRCPICNVGRINAYQMRKHIAAVHIDERPEVCNVCQKRCSDKANLNAHMKIHNKEKPYKCKICMKGFHTNKCKTRHEISVHSKEKPYQCEVCGKSYPSRDYLQAHRWYSHNNKQSSIPPKSILSKEEIEKIVGEEMFKGQTRGSSLSNKKGESGEKST